MSKCHIVEIFMPQLNYNKGVHIIMYKHIWTYLYPRDLQIPSAVVDEISSV